QRGAVRLQQRGHGDGGGDVRAFHRHRALGRAGAAEPAVDAHPQAVAAHASPDAGDRADGRVREEHRAGRHLPAAGAARVPAYRHLAGTGALLAVAGMLYLMLVGRWLLPRHIDADEIEEVEIGKYVTELALTAS